MCNPASMIVLRDRVVWSKASDSHEDIISEYGLHFNGVKGPNGVRVEISPPDLDYCIPLEDWVFKVDQDHFPPWWDKKEAEFRVRQELPDWADAKLIRGGQARPIRKGDVIICICGGYIPYVTGGIIEEMKGGRIGVFKDGLLSYLTGGRIETMAGGMVKRMTGGVISTIDDGVVRRCLGGNIERISGGIVSYTSPSIPFWKSNPGIFIDFTSSPPEASFGYCASLLASIPRGQNPP